MSKISVFNKDVDSSLTQQLNPVVYLPKIAAPYTTVVKRAQCTDFSNDLLPRFGIERVMTQAIMEVQGEVGPAGERVWKLINDVHDAVRFVGDISAVNNNDGQNLLMFQAGNSYVEITFYGTGINMLARHDASSRSVTPTVDGVAQSAINYSTVSHSPVLNGRNYATNMIVPIWSGSLGFHTVKIAASSNNTSFYGYEILNTNTTLQQTAGTSYLGGKRLYQPALTTSSPTSGFANTYGTAGTRGGHVLVYQKADGSVAKDIQYTEASAAYLASANHTNESVIRTYHWREFGAGRTSPADDFSTLTTTIADRAFTLDDGTTTLVGFQVSNTNGSERLLVGGLNSFVTLTFVGTGIDVIRADDAATIDPYSVTVDGVNQGNLAAIGVGGQERTTKLASGLPYGTHTVKITRTTAAIGAVRFSQFIVYGPSKPVLPTGCVELADYYDMADYANDAASPNTVDTISTGVLRKLQLREMVYSGTWTIDAFSSGVAGGFSTYTSSATTDYVEYTFFGTGFNLRSPGGTGSGAVSWTASLNGPANTNWSSYTTSISAGGTVSSWTASTGLLSVPTSASRYTLFVSGLPLGKHTVRMTKTSGAFVSYFNGFDIITPVHSPKGNAPGDLQNTLPVGSCAIGDNRKFSETSVKPLANWAQAVGMATTTTTSTSYVPIADMSTTIKTTGNPIDVRFSINSRHSSAAVSTYYKIYVDGVPVSQEFFFSEPTANYTEVVTFSLILPLSSGVHKVDAYWKTDSGTATTDSTGRSLTVTEL
jgi:hypothetical protein